MAEPPVFAWSGPERPALLPVDTTVHGAEPFRPAVRTVVHKHDGNTPAEFDGHPDAWFTPGLTTNGPLFTTNLYRYPNQQPPTTLWYHDHAIGITRLNVYAGLAGFYLLRDRAERRLRLPEGPYEIPLAIQDRPYDANAQFATSPVNMHGTATSSNTKITR